MLTIDGFLWVLLIYFLVQFLCDLYYINEEAPCVPRILDMITHSILMLSALWHLMH